MNRREHLLTILMEECAELSQEAAKILRFGHTKEKGVRFQKEYNDVLAAVEMLYKEGIDAHDDNDLVEAKQAKVEKYLLESKKLGTLSD